MLVNINGNYFLEKANMEPQKDPGCEAEVSVIASTSTGRNLDLSF